MASRGCFGFDGVARRQDVPKLGVGVPELRALAAAARTKSQVRVVFLTFRLSQGDAEVSEESLPASLAVRGGPHPLPALNCRVSSGVVCVSHVANILRSAHVGRRRCRVPHPSSNCGDGLEGPSPLAGCHGHDLAAFSHFCGLSDSCRNDRAVLGADLEGRCAPQLSHVRNVPGGAPFALRCHFRVEGGSGMNRGTTCLPGRVSRRPGGAIADLRAAPTGGRDAFLAPGVSATRTAFKLAVTHTDDRRGGSSATDVGGDAISRRHRGAISHHARSRVCRTDRHT
jgi:hypothetical protein